MRKNYLLATILILAIIVTTIRFANLSYSASLDSADDDGTLQTALNDSSGARTPAEFDLMPALAAIISEIFLLWIVLYRLTDPKITIKEFLAREIFRIRPPPFDAVSVA